MAGWKVCSDLLLRNSFGRLDSPPTGDLKMSNGTSQEMRLFPTSHGVLSAKGERVQ